MKVGVEIIMEKCNKELSKPICHQDSKYYDICVNEIIDILKKYE